MCERERERVSVCEGGRERGDLAREDAEAVCPLFRLFVQLRQRAARERKGEIE